MDLGLPSLSELNNALAQRKNFGDVAKEMLAAHTAGQEQAYKQADTGAQIIQRIAEAQKFAHEAQKSPTQGQLSLESLKGLVPDNIYNAMLTAATLGPDGKPYIKPETVSVFGTPSGVRKETDVERRHREEMAAAEAARKRAEARQESKDQLSAAKTVDAAYEKKAPIKKAWNALFKTDEYKAATMAKKVLKKTLNGTPYTEEQP